MSTVDALAAGVLGRPGLARPTRSGGGRPADLVVYDTDPRPT